MNFDKFKYPFTLPSFKKRFWQAIHYIRSPRGIASIIITLIGSLVGSIITIML